MLDSPRLLEITLYTRLSSCCNVSGNSNIDGKSRLLVIPKHATNYEAKHNLLNIIKVPSWRSSSAQLRRRPLANSGLLFTASASHHTVPTCKVSTSDLLYFLKYRLTKKRYWVITHPQNLAISWIWYCRASAALRNNLKIFTYKNHQFLLLTCDNWKKFLSSSNPICA